MELIFYGETKKNSISDKSDKHGIKRMSAAKRTSNIHAHAYTCINVMRECVYEGADAAGHIIYRIHFQCFSQWSPIYGIKFKLYCYNELPLALCRTRCNRLPLLFTTMCICVFMHDDNQGKQINFLVRWIVCVCNLTELNFQQESRIFWVLVSIKLNKSAGINLPHSWCISSYCSNFLVTNWQSRKDVYRWDSFVCPVSLCMSIAHNSLSHSFLLHWTRIINKQSFPSKSSHR